MGKSLQADEYSRFIAFTDLHLSPVALHIGPFDLRWYSLAYLAGIFVGYWYLLKLIRQPGAPLARRKYRPGRQDRKSTRLNSSHVEISYAVFCLKKKTQKDTGIQ